LNYFLKLNLYKALKLHTANTQDDSLLMTFSISFWTERQLFSPSRVNLRGRGWNSHRRGSHALNAHKHTQLLSLELSFWNITSTEFYI